MSKALSKQVQVQQWRHGTATTYSKRGCRCEECRAAKSEAARKYRDPEKEIARVRAWNEQNPGRAALRVKNWHKANPEKRRIQKKIRRARERNAPVVGVINMEILWTGWCGLCTKPMDREILFPDPMSPTVDHIIPLSRGGAHSQENVQWAHMICNSRKGNR